MNDQEMLDRPDLPGEESPGPRFPGPQVVAERRGGRWAMPGAVLLVVLLAAGAAVAVVADPPSGDADASGNATCAPPQADDAPGYPALCAALNRPDLPDLAGVPGGRVSLAGSHLVLRLGGDGKEPPVATAQVQIGSVQVSVTDHPDMAPEDFLLFSDLPRTQAPVLGHPITAYRMRTMGGAPATGGRCW
ncbi:DUF6215 domain-containing protein [Kitasatospora misakiensis]|uniref:DUF6215 domain-containing protein n=1 Tax=Kitasatospora misakiensis TaxID=67330 RepID=A0ABW0XIZ4_9ACTN